MAIGVEGAVAAQSHPQQQRPDERHAPGDTLAFMEFSRTDGYRAYLDASLMGRDTGFECLSSTRLYEIPFPASAGTIAFQSHLPSAYRRLLQWYSLGDIRFLKDAPISISLDEDWGCRTELSEHIFKNLALIPSDWARWISLRARALFPKSLLENLSARFHEACTFPARKILYSANAWPLIDDWKILALAQRERHGARLVGSPHAIGHGCLVDFWQREFEIDHLDVYLTWGWKRKDDPGRVIPFYSPNFAGQRQARRRNTNQRQEILISSAARPRHLLEYPYLPDSFAAYLRLELDVAEQAQQLTHRKVSIRTRPRDLGWDLKAMVASLRNPNIHLEFQQDRFLNRLEQSWLHICDNCSTTIAESLWANHPTLILITGDYFRISSSAACEFQRLAEAGVFHSSAESLLNQLNKVKDDLAGWWASRLTQQAVRTFVHAQCRDGSSLNHWKRALQGKYPGISNA